jgi:uncharacterized protein (DUF1810 family)
MHDEVSLSRYLIAQDGTYEQALKEIRNGKKLSHWMWYVFPQLEGLGVSVVSKKFAIASKEEAMAYLAHPILGFRIVEITEALLQFKEKSAEDIFGKVDAVKLRSSLTLFALCTCSESIFTKALALYFNNEIDEYTKLKLD